MPGYASLSGLSLPVPQTTQKLTPEQLQALIDAANQRVTDKQMEAANVGEADPANYALDGPEALKAALATGLFSLLGGSRGGYAGKEFADGYLKAHHQRIDSEHQKAVQNLEKKKQIRLIEAEGEAKKAASLAGQKEQLVAALRAKQEQDARMAQIQAGIQGDKEVAGIRANTSVENSLLTGLRTAGPEQRLLFAGILRQAFPDKYGALSDEQIAAQAGFTPKELSDVAGAGLKTTQAADIKATQPGRVAKLLAEGKRADAQAELDVANKTLAEARTNFTKAQTKNTDAKTGLVNKQVAWYDKTIAAQIAAKEKTAEAAIIKANADASKALKGGGVGASTLFTAHQSAKKAKDEAIGALDGLKVEEKMLNARLAAISANDTDKLINKQEIASIQAVLAANAKKQSFYTYQINAAGKRGTDIMRQAQNGGMQPSSASSVTGEARDYQNGLQLIKKHPEKAEQIRQMWRDAYGEDPPF